MFNLNKVDLEDLKMYLQTKQRLSKGTIVTRLSRIRIFLSWASTKIPSHTIIEEFFLYLKTEKHLTNTSLNTYVASLSSLRNYMVDRSLSDDFMKGIRVFKEEEVAIDSLTEEECSKLLGACYNMRNKVLEKNFKALTIYLLLTGSRFEDGQALVIKNIDFSGKRVSYMQLKTHRIRHVYVSSSLLEVLKEMCQDRPGDEHVFKNSIGGRIHYPDYHKYLKSLAKAAGITKRVSAHILRHSYSQTFYDSTGDAFLLKDVLGHREIASTQRYISNSHKRIRDAQLLHPFLKKEVDPRMRIQKIKELIEGAHLEEDERFDYMIVQEALGDFFLKLQKSVKTV